jgi:hypothetical protein
MYENPVSSVPFLYFPYVTTHQFGENSGLQFSAWYYLSVFPSLSHDEEGLPQGKEDLTCHVN